jgi:DNA (cytosine-5)-methyltransferase 1
MDLFSGAGGFSLGFHSAGCRILAAADVDEAAGQTFLENFRRLQCDDPPLVAYGDEGDLERMDLPRLATGGVPDVLIGSPPCQGFSRVGRAKLDSLSDEGFEGDPRNQLYQQYLEAAELWRPSALVMENVPGMLSVGGRNIADEAAAEMASRGYRVGYAVLNAVWYGVPQFRERVFFIGIRDDLAVNPVMPATTHWTDLPAGYARPKGARTLPLPFVRHYELPVNVRGASLPATTVSDALDDLPVLTDHLTGDSVPLRGDFRRDVPYSRDPHSGYARLMRNWPGFSTPESLCDHVVRRTPRDYETFRRMSPGDRYPAALGIARQRLSEELMRLAERDSVPQAGTAEFRELERRFVPPYPEESFVDKWRKLFPDQPSWTVPAHLSKDAYSHIHYDSGQARAISIREAARLQSFPDAFVFLGNMGDCYRQVGNAVPPLVGWVLACEVLKLLGIAPVRPFPLGV